MASDDLSTVKLQPVYDPLLSATVTNSTVTFAREPTFNDVYGSGASPMIVAHDQSIQRIPPSRRIETISSVKSFGVEHRESTESVSKEAYDATVREREAFRVRVQQLRARYGQSAIVWYDEPTFIEDGVVQPCWMQGEDHPVLVARACDHWEYRAIEDPRWKPLAGRRVCPITRPPEPTT